jgi:FtsP/CotA-like multicopper oxidase with cupredoxin domain
LGVTSGAGATEAANLVQLIASNTPAAEPAAPPTRLRTIDVMSATGATRTIRLGEMEMMDKGEMSMMFTINDKSFPDVPEIASSSGSRELWRIVNETEMDHPFHLHGFFFQPEGKRELKDTINIPGKATVPLIVDFDARQDAAGSWAYHCHILEHAEGGMMGVVKVGQGN